MSFGNNYKIKDNVVEIYVKQRNGNFHIVFIDKSDLKKLVDFGHSVHVQWNERGKAYYPHITIYEGFKDRIIKNKNVKLTTFLLNISDSSRIDHINHNTLDTRRKNLRVVTQSENLRNRKSKNSNNTSGYRNVTKMGNWWRVQLQVDGKNRLFPEKFEDVHEAGKFAEEMRDKYYGNFSGKN